MKALTLPWLLMKSTMDFTSTSELALGPWYESEQGLLLAPGPGGMKKKKKPTEDSSFKKALQDGGVTTCTNKFLTV